jgi:alanine racemase
MVRVGISVYGVSPFDNRSAEDMGFSPVMVAKARVVDSSNQGDTVLGMGYTDGLLPLTANTGWLDHRGTRGTITRVRSGKMSVTWPKGKQPAVGDIITLFGDPAGGSPRAEDWAKWADTIGDEVVAAMPARTPRVYLS